MKSLPVSFLSEYKSLLRLGLPVLVTQLGIITVSFADTAMVGAYGVRELASAAFVNSIFMIPVVMQIGFAQGTTPLVGALFGRGETSAIGRMLKSGLQVNALISMAFTLLMTALYFLLPYFGQPEELLPTIRGYYLTVLGGLLPMAVFNVCQQTSNGLTDTATPMWVMLGANALNIFGNWLLIYGHWGCPELGLLGAGIATLLSRVAGAVAMILIFSNRRRFRPYWEEARKATGLGSERLSNWVTSYPVMIQCGLEVTLWSVGAIVCGWYGKVQLAAYQVANTIAQLGFMIFMSFGVAVSVRVANYTGQSDRTGVRRITIAGLHINLLLATLACIVFFFWGVPLGGLFTPDAEVRASIALLIAPLILYQYGDAVQLTYANALRGTSDVKPLMLVAVIAYVAAGIPCLFLLGVFFDMQNIGVYYSFTVALFTAAILLRHFFLRAMRKIN